METLYLDTKEAAKILNLSPSTLDKWRYIGGGPRYYKFGRAVRYTEIDLVEWAKSAHIEPNTQQANQ